MTEKECIAKSKYLSQLSNEQLENLLAELNAEKKFRSNSTEEIEDRKKLWNKCIRSCLTAFTKLENNFPETLISLGNSSYYIKKIKSTNFFQMNFCLLEKE